MTSAPGATAIAAAGHAPVAAAGPEATRRLVVTGRAGGPAATRSLVTSASAGTLRRVGRHHGPPVDMRTGRAPAGVLPVRVLLMMMRPLEVGDVYLPRDVGVVGCSGGVLLSHDLSVAVPSALEGLASGFGMGPGVSPPL